MKFVGFYLGLAVILFVNAYFKLPLLWQVTNAVLWGVFAGVIGLSCGISELIERHKY